MTVLPGQVYQVPDGHGSTYEIEVVSVTGDWVECRNRPPMYDGYTFQVTSNAFESAWLVSDASW